jgi:hypothetical protein
VFVLPFAGMSLGRWDRYEQIQEIKKKAINSVTNGVRRLFRSKASYSRNVFVTRTSDRMKLTRPSN